MKLFEQKLMKRLSITKGLWMLFWIAAFFLIPVFFNEPSMMLRVGFLFWYITLWWIIWLFWVMDYHSVIKMKLPWWFRWTFFWWWMMFLLVLFIYDDIAGLMIWTTFEWLSPYYIILEWVFFWLIADYFGTKFGWEWKKLLD